MQEQTIEKGGCLCGAIRYEVAAPVERILMCHCRNCQKATGAGASANVVVPAAALTFSRGTPRLFSQQVDSGHTLHRAFCGDCGSPIYSRRDHVPDWLVLKVGTLDRPHGAVVANLWTQSASAWTPIQAGVDNYPQNRPA